MELTHISVNELRLRVLHFSRTILEITTRAGSGHPSSSLSMIDILTALYLGGVLRYDPQHPAWPDRDRFILSKGHGAPGLYTVLAAAGYFDPAMLPTLRETGSPLEGHPNMRRLPGVEASTGSLGQGLSIGVGHALAARVDGRAYRTYVLLGDGEIDEGQVWEATMAASQYKLASLTAILDVNGYQQTGAVDDIMSVLTPMADKWRSFGWRVFEIDGHDMNQIVETFNVVHQINDAPQMIVARTKKGRGLSPFEADDTNRKHGKPLDEDELEIALSELDELEAALREEQ